jgi:uroporphyrinogen-III decarboxylase
MPVSMMFASYLAGFRYRDYATDHGVQAAAQLRVAEEFHLDHVSVISDPCCEAADCGSEIMFFDDEPPAPPPEAKCPLRDKAKLTGLSLPNPAVGQRMSNRLEAVRDLTQQVAGELLVEGWVEGPCAEAADLRGINALMLDFYYDPKFVASLVDDAPISLANEP